MRTNPIFPIFDITSCEGVLKSLGELLHIDEREIVKYVATRKNEYSVDDFLEVFDISEDQLSGKETAEHPYYGHCTS